MPQNIILKELRNITHHNCVELTLCGNAAITSALSIFPEGSTVLIPEEGGWIHYQKAPVQLGLKIVEVKCDDAKINLADLQEKINSERPSAFLYQNPGGYFAQQPMKEIYGLCLRNKCAVIMDVSGSLGTPLGNGNYADILVGSFGKWKLVDAKTGGFISTNDKGTWGKLKPNITILENSNALSTVQAKLDGLQQRIAQLQQLQKKILVDLQELNPIYCHDAGFVVVVKYITEDEKKEILAYCVKHQLAYTQCPRYIRVNKAAISIELKQIS